MKNKTIFVFIGFLLFFFPFCSDNKVRVKPEKNQFSINYSWGRGNMCQQGISPRITLKNVPPGTRTLQVKLEDIRMPQKYHGNETLIFKGSKYIKAGALRSYVGPCPEQGHTHGYRFTVLALDIQGNIIGKAEKFKRCSNIY